MNALKNDAMKISMKKPKKKCSKKYAMNENDQTKENKFCFTFQDDFDAYILNRLSDIIHSLLVTYTDSYLVYFDTLVPHFYSLLQQTRSVSDRQWALCVFDDVIQFTGAHSHRYSQFFLTRMADSVADQSAEVGNFFFPIVSESISIVCLDSPSSFVRIRCNGNEWWSSVCTSLCRSIAASFCYDLCT